MLWVLSTYCVRRPVLSTYCVPCPVLSLLCVAPGAEHLLCAVPCAELLLCAAPVLSTRCVQCPVLSSYYVLRPVLSSRHVPCPVLSLLCAMPGAEYLLCASVLSACCVPRPVLSTMGDKAKQMPTLTELKLLLSVVGVEGLRTKGRSSLPGLDWRCHPSAPWPTVWNTPFILGSKLTHRPDFPSEPVT